MLKPLAVICSCLLLALGAGCGGDGQDDDAAGGGGGARDASQNAPEKAGQDAGSGGSGAGGETAAVRMKNIEFNPKNISVTKGTRVAWTNDDSAPHDVTKTEGPGPKFSSGTGNLKRGDVYEQTFNTAGKITYVCKVHPGMEGTVTVK